MADSITNSWSRIRAWLNSNAPDAAQRLQPGATNAHLQTLEAAGLEALEGFVSERTSWLIAHHMEGHAVVDRTIGSRRRKRLRESPWFDDLVTLAECDAAGRIPGMQVDDLDQALDYIRQIETMFG